MAITQVIPIVYSDLYHGWTIDNQGGIRIAYNVDAVASSVFNILSIAKGEYFFNPTFGANLRGYLFEQISEEVATRITTNIKNEITKWDPRVNVVSVTLQPIQNQNEVYIAVQFSVKGSPQIFQMVTQIN